MGQDNLRTHNIFHSIKIIGDPNSIEKKILLDGQELRGVKSASVLYEVDNMPRVFLEFMTTDIEVDEPISAVMRVQDKEENE